MKVGKMDLLVFLIKFLLVVTIAFIPGLVWLVFFAREDVHPEPKKMVAKVFLAGMVITLPTVAVQIVLDSLFNFLGATLIVVFGFLFIFITAAVEEVAKFLAAYLNMEKNKTFNEPLDAMIYMVAAATGFATVENLFILLELAGSSFNLGQPIFWQHFFVRFAGATFLHVISSGLVGYYWAKVHWGKKRSEHKLTNKKLIWGLFLASLIHAWFNALVNAFQGYNYLVYPTIFLVLIALPLFIDFEKLKHKIKGTASQVPDL